MRSLEPRQPIGHSRSLVKPKHINQTPPPPTHPFPVPFYKKNLYQVDMLDVPLIQAFFGKNIDVQ